MFCSKCGNKLNDTDKFCAKCGTKIEEISSKKVELTKSVEDSESTLEVENSSQEIISKENHQESPQHNENIELNYVIRTLSNDYVDDKTHNWALTDIHNNIKVCSKGFNVDKQKMVTFMDVTLLYLDDTVYAFYCNDSNFVDEVIATISMNVFEVSELTKSVKDSVRISYETYEKVKTFMKYSIPIAFVVSFVWFKIGNPLKLGYILIVIGIILLIYKNNIIKLFEDDFEKNHVKLNYYMVGHIQLEASSKMGMMNKLLETAKIQNIPVMSERERFLEIINQMALKVKPKYNIANINQDEEYLSKLEDDFIHEFKCIISDLENGISFKT